MACQGEQREQQPRTAGHHYIPGPTLTVDHGHLLGRTTAICALHNKATISLLAALVDSASFRQRHRARSKRKVLKVLDFVHQILSLDNYQCIYRIRTDRVGKPKGTASTHTLWIYVALAVLGWL
eukprot:scaffold166188_cov39-Prasinocladus_malaysianus.AAC.2